MFSRLPLNAGKERRIINIQKRRYKQSFWKVRKETEKNIHNFNEPPITQQIPNKFIKTETARN